MIEQLDLFPSQHRAQHGSRQGKLPGQIPMPTPLLCAALGKESAPDTATSTRIRGDELACLPPFRPLISQARSPQVSPSPASPDQVASKTADAAAALLLKEGQVNVCPHAHAIALPKADGARLWQEPPPIETAGLVTGCAVAGPLMAMVTINRLGHSLEVSDHRCCMFRLDGDAPAQIKSVAAQTYQFISQARINRIGFSRASIGYPDHQAAAEIRLQTIIAMLARLKVIRLDDHVVDAWCRRTRPSLPNHPHGCRWTAVQVKAIRNAQFLAAMREAY